MDIRIWSGIRGDQAYDSDGALYCQNIRFYIDGELQRRRGMAFQNAQGGNTIQNYQHPLTGYWNGYSTAGGLIVVEAL